MGRQNAVPPIRAVMFIESWWVVGYSVFRDCSPFVKIMIFISHSTADDEFVNQLRTHLRQLGYQTFVDHFDIPAGHHWDDVVEQNLSRSEALILVLSPDAVTSQNVKVEWSIYFKEYEDRPLIPVIARPCRIPLLLRLMNHIDFSDGQVFESQFGKLQQSLPLPPDERERQHTMQLDKGQVQLANTTVQRMKIEMERIQLERNSMIGYNQLLISLTDFGKVHIYDLDKGKLFIGWVHSINDPRPEIDLTKYKAHESGVSRQHAMITRMDNKLTLEDVGSLNGTEVDGKKLNMYERIDLRNGSQVRLGSLRMLLFYKLSPQS